MPVCVGGTGVWSTCLSTPSSLATPSEQPLWEAFGVRRGGDRTDPRHCEACASVRGGQVSEGQVGSEEQGRASEEDGAPGETPLTLRAWPREKVRMQRVGGSGGAGERRERSSETVGARSLVAGGTRDELPQEQAEMQPQGRACCAAKCLSG